MNIGRSLVDVGQTFVDSRNQSQQQQEHGDIEAFMRQAMSGDPVAFQDLMIKSPDAARMVAEHLQAQQASQQGEEDIFKSKIALDTAGFVEQMHLAPSEQQEAMFNSAIDDPRYDIDEYDRGLFMDVNARKAIIGQVKGKDYADNFFGQKDKTSGFQQGTGDMSGYSFNPNDGTFSINDNLKAKLDEAKINNKLELKDKITLNKEFTNLTKDTKLIRNTAADLDKLAKINSGPAALAMVFKFMKALDPTSVVREGEQASAENSAGVPEAVRNMYNKVMSGARLGEEQMKQFVYTAKQLANSAIDSSKSEITDYLNTFENDLTPNFRKALLQRIPTRFDIAEKAVDTVEEVVVDTVNQDAQALEWANANPSDPRSQAILKKLQGGA